MTLSRSFASHASGSGQAASPPLSRRRLLHAGRPMPILPDGEPIRELIYGDNSMAFEAFDSVSSESCGPLG